MIYSNYCNVSCQNKHQNSIKADNKFGKVKEFQVKCHCCSGETVVEEREKLFPQKDKYFCSRSCANTRTHSEETKEKIRKSLKKEVTKRDLLKLKRKEARDRGEKKERKKTTRNRKKTIRLGNCLHCKKEFIKRSKTTKLCSKSCLQKWLKATGVGRKGGLASAKAQAETRRSKNEMHFAKLCGDYFETVLTNEPIFNGWDADVIIEDIKFAVLWNGKWHYEKITESHSVKQVQNRDRIKIKEIEKMDYIPYVIKDMGKANKKFVENKFETFLDYLKQNNYICV